MQIESHDPEDLLVCQGDSLTVDQFTASSANMLQEYPRPLAPTKR